MQNKGIKIKKNQLIFFILLIAIGAMLILSRYQKGNVEPIEEIESFSVDFEGFNIEDNIDYIEKHAVELPDGRVIDKCTVEISDIEYYVDENSVDENSIYRLHYRVRVINDSDDIQHIRFLFTYSKVFLSSFMYSGTFISTPTRDVESNKGFSFSIDEIVASIDNLTEENRANFVYMIRHPLIIVEFNGVQYPIKIEYNGEIDGI